jgi:tetratricopeptide (TPR) repeat protein
MDQDEGPDDPLRIPDAAHSCGFSSHLVGGILASRPAKGKLSKQKGPMLLARTLCLLASQGSTGFSRLLMGSTTEKVAREMPCSVMTLKQEHVIRLPLEKELADIETHLRRGKELLQKKMIESAIAQFEYCIRRNALFIPAWEELAGVYRNTGKKNEARKCEEMAAHICKYLRENQKEDMQK